MKYFFILGNNPTLSFAEIKAILSLKPNNIVFFNDLVLIIDYPHELNAEHLINMLGGTIKIGLVHKQVPEINNDLIGIVMKFLNKDIIKTKFNFGFSYYGSNNFDFKKLGIGLKTELKKRDINSRWVTSHHKQLSSVVVTQNKMLNPYGQDVVIIQDYNHHYYCGQTLAVQPFKLLSARDYGRPSRDDYSGMLPPKLAKIMLNLAQAIQVKSKPSITYLLDPFCGSGTVLTEAALMGYSNIYGSDKSAVAVNDTKKNLSWLMQKYKIANIQSKILKCDVRLISKQMKDSTIDIIVTEPYLGPSRSHVNKINVAKLANSLEQLYHEAILQFSKVLKINGSVVMVWPVFMINKHEPFFLNTKNILKNSPLHKADLLLGFKHKSLTLTDRRTLLYKREGQKVIREIVILTKQTKGDNSGVTKK